MIRLIYYQFNRSKKQWLGISPVIFISSLVVGLAFNGYLNVAINSQVFLGLPDPKPIFLFPIVFGGVTLFFVISTLISMLVQTFREDYNLLEILGASRFHLSFLVGGQIFIISTIVSIVGYICSLPVTINYYHFLQHFFGKNILPDIQFRMSILGFVSTVLLISFLTFLSGCYYSLKSMKHKIISPFRKKIRLVRKAMLLCFIFFIWGTILIQIFRVQSILTKAQMIFNLVIFNMAVIYQISPYIQGGAIKLLSKVIFRKRYMYIFSKWNLLFNNSYIKSISASAIGIITLISSFQMISQNILARFQDNGDLELKVAFIVYVGAPILIVLANIMSIAILSLEQEKNEIKQLELLGASNFQMVMIKLGESIFLTTVISLLSLLLNIVIMLLIAYCLKEDSLLRSFNYSGLFLSNIIISIMLFTVLFLSKSAYFIIKNIRDNIIKLLANSNKKVYNGDG
ncbi:TPA: hypothetical protein ACGOVI_000768 [Streptococcus suis]